MQRAVLANAIANITVPAIGNWLLVKDEEWYKDLPEWRKVFFHNFKVGEHIISLPVAYEFGVLFGSTPVAILDSIYGGNPASVGELVKGALFSHIRGIGSFLPPLLQGGLETETGHDFFRQRSQVSPWLTERSPPAEQVNPSTTVVAQELFKSMQPLMLAAGIDNPVELENLLGSVTGDATTTGMKLIDEIFSLKDHPGIQPGAMAPFGLFVQRFTRQIEHGNSRTVQALYDREKELVQRTDTLNFDERQELRRIQGVRDDLSDVRRLERAGSIDRNESARRQFEIANRVMNLVR
jgi:hypothetical protein